MASRTINAISLCSGVGMLDVGLAAGLEHLGFDLRTILYAEREAYPAAVLGARMEEGSLHPAPIWFGDFTKLTAAKFRGVVDCIVAGFPCQDLSLAGKRAGLDGARSGLFFDILDIADACGARGLFLENVAGIASATASVVDEAEGDLEERAAARVLGELADRGWHAEWLTLSASDVGASHGRARWFCWAWRTMDDTTGARCDGARQRTATDSSGRECLSGEGCTNMGYATSKGLQERGQPSQRELSAQAGSRLHHRPEQSGNELAYTSQHGRREGWPEPGREQGRPDAAEHGGAVADARCERRQQISRGASGNEGTNEGRSSKDDHIAPGTCAAVADASLQGLQIPELNELRGERGGG